jgi:hypothetical protein
MAEKIKLISDAVVKLGDAPVLTLDDGRVAAIAGDARYNGIVRKILAKHHWGFARKQQSLSRLTGVAFGNYQFAFQLPADWVLIIRTDPAGDFAIYGDQLHTNQDAVRLEYVYHAPEAKWPNYFAEVVVCKLAEELALPVTGARTLKAEMGLEYDRALGDAYWADAQGQTAVAFHDNPLRDVRS